VSSVLNIAISSCASSDFPTCARNMHARVTIGRFGAAVDALMLRPP
jgi:hypothetical protein